mgnify:CR=1 FL=1
MSEYQIGKSIQEVQSQAGSTQVHKMSSNENPFGPSPLAIEAMQNSLSSLHFYPQRTDIAVTQALAKHFGRNLSAANFTTANGAVDLINLLENATFEKAKTNSIVICPPCFGSYAASAKLKGAQVIEHPLDANTFDIDCAGLASSVTEDTRLVYVCNPNNPTGSYFDEAALLQILDSLPEHVTLVYDEVYYHYATEFAMPDAIGALLNERNLVILHSFSKAYGLAGLRTGYAIASEAMIAKMTRHKLSFQNDTVSMAAITAAITDSAHLQKVVDNNTQQRHWLCQQLKDLDIQFWPTQANFICFKAPCDQSAAVIVEKLISYGVMVRAAFYLPNHVRVSIGLPQANQQFIHALSEIITQLKCPK